MWTAKAVLLFSLFYVTIGRYTTAPQQTNAVSKSDGVNYLRKFGYASSPNSLLGNLMTKEELKKSIREFQRFAHLPRTGELDAATLAKMADKRCGVPDFAGTESQKRKKRYALRGKWDHKDLTYSFENYEARLGQAKTMDSIKQALEMWAADSGLTFRLIANNPRNPADIVIKFVRGEHGDGDPFDGKGKTLAHAFFPTGSSIGGDAHFDADEYWEIKSTRDGTNLIIAGAHEFGHSLGLAHSDVQDSLMAPFYNPSFKGLHSDDIKAIQSLYGKPYRKEQPKTTKSTTTRRPRPTKRPSGPKTTTPKSKPQSSVCNGRFDAITLVANGTTFAFAGKIYWRLNDNGMDKGYPRNIEQDWGVAGPIDAALTREKITYLFKGEHVYQYVNANPIGPKRLIRHVFKGIPSDIDSAFVWSGNNKMYFTKGGLYWRYNPFFRDTDSNYPRNLTVWRGLPSKGVDSALQWNRRTYFFNKGFYWRFDDEKIRVAENLQMPYPRRSDRWWLGCSDNTLMATYDEELNKKDPAGGSAGTITSTLGLNLLAMFTSFIISQIIG